MIPVRNIEIYSANNIVDLEEASKLIKKFKKQKKKVGICHGGFDLPHPGQVKHLESAKGLCDILCASITSDKFVKSRKGQGRPILPDKLRAYMIANLKFVDYVFISDFQKGIEVIEYLKPSFYIKGPDFINKMTPGIIAERQAISKVGGEMKYTSDPKLSTTEIISYIKNEMNEKNILLGIDRDGTLIREENFLGKEDNWRDKINLKENIISLVSFLQTKYKTTKIVLSNQAGVAKKYFDCKRVERINRYIDDILEERGIKIDNWQYCPEVDSKYAKLKEGEIEFDSNFVKDKTKRKPSSQMLLDGLKDLGKDISDFSYVVIIGDRQEDMELAENLNSLYIDAQIPYREAVKKVNVEID